MSDFAFDELEKTVREEQSRYQARRIWSAVQQHRGSIPSAGRRWPFELLQNALDAGPRAGNSTVAVRLGREQGKVVFEHDGAPFKSSDLAALLSGGSNKDSESEVTTGRFGTGFLVTHALAERTKIRGLLETPDGIERFELELDRGGDEEAILRNITECRENIRYAKPVSDLRGIESARFEYRLDKEDPMTLGLESLKSALPYLYATRKSLGRVEFLNENDATEIWNPAGAIERTVENGCVEERTIEVSKGGIVRAELSVFRFMSDEQGSASALVLLERSTEGWGVVLPSRNAPRIYREYPLSETGFIPLNFVLDGKFTPDQERGRLLSNDEENKKLINEAFASAVMAVEYAFAYKWTDAHLLAKAHTLATGFDARYETEKDWWHEQVKSFAEQVAKLPIVECSSRTLPAISHTGGAYADFIVPRLQIDSSDDETTVERMWPLVEKASNLLTPRKELASDWSEIAAGWHSLGLSVNRIGVSNLPEWVLDGADTLDQLNVDGNPKEWIAGFLDVAGECWENRSGVDLTVLDKMLPDQNKRLRSPADLAIDNDIPDSLKDICAGIGLDVRSQILLSGFDEVAEANEMNYVCDALKTALRDSLSEEHVIQKAVDSLSASLPEDVRCEEASAGIQRGSVRLLSYLWATKKDQARATVGQIPLVTDEGVAVRWRPTRMMMAPVRCWRESAQPFADAYPPNRILAEMYAGSSSEDVPDCVEALVAWNIAIADPIHTDTPSELTEHRLSRLSTDDTNGVTVPKNTEEFSQIALLQPAVLNRCREGIDAARALFGLVLCHIAPHDPMWMRTRNVRGRRSGQDVDVPVATALWLADLGVRPWVPVSGDEGELVPMPANNVTLDKLLDPIWLQNNDAAIKLLSEWFGFDRLHLRLLGVAPDEKKREQVRDGLSKLLEFGGDDPEAYTLLAEEMAQRKKQGSDIKQMQRMGIGVQQAIKSAMEEYKLELELVDKGFDYKITVSKDDVLDDMSTRLEIGDYLLEIKATTTGQARLTPLQAETASSESDRYLLCVVDLRSFQHVHLPEQWSAAMVEPLAKIVPDIGSRIRPTYSLVEAAMKKSIAVRNETALRYEVPSEIWEKGVSIREWVSNIPNGFVETRRE